MRWSMEAFENRNVIQSKRSLLSISIHLSNQSGAFSIFFLCITLSHTFQATLLNLILWIVVCIALENVTLCDCVTTIENNELE